MDMISPLIEDLMTYADGRPVDKKTQAALDEKILDYIDGELDGKAARDVEALMRLFLNIARLVADKTEETRLQNRLSMFFDGELDPEASAELQNLIASDPEVARQARQIRQGGDLLRVVLQPIPGQRQSSDEIETIPGEPMSSPGNAMSIACFSSLIAFAMGAKIDKPTQSALDKMIVDYIGDELDRVAVRGIEASMRVSPCVARLIADKARG